MAPTLVGTPLRTGWATTRSPTTGNVASAGVLQADDVVISFLRAGTGSAAATLVANWNNANPAGANSVTNGGSCSMMTIWHTVTAAEVTAGTRAWTFTNLWNASQTGATYTYVVRGADPTNPIDAFGEDSSGGAVNPQTLADLLGSDISNTSDLVLAGIGADNTATYTDPSGWTLGAKNAGGQNTGACYSANSSPTPGTNWPATNITPSTGGTYASNTVAVKAPGGASVNGDATVSTSVSVIADGHVEKHGNATISIAPSVNAAGYRTVVGDATIALPITVTAVGTRTVHANATIVIPVDVLSSGNTQGMPAGDVTLAVPIEIAADGTVIRYGNVAISVDVDVDASGNVGTSLDGDVQVDIPIQIEADGTLYKLVPKTGWYCFPEEDLPGPPYDVPFTPGT